MCGSMVGPSIRAKHGGWTIHATHAERISPCRGAAALLEACREPGTGRDLRSVDARSGLALLLALGGFSVERHAHRCKRLAVAGLRGARNRNLSGAGAVRRPGPVAVRRNMTGGVGRRRRADL